MRNPSTPDATPRVTVLLATRNGLRFIGEQLDSILGQAGVTVRVVALDDESTDGTAEWLAERASRESRLTVLHSEGASGSAAANFFRLVLHAPLDGNDLVAFADQDDIWMPDKLSRHAALIDSLGVAAVSSNVISFTERGARTLVRKDYRQREFDYLFESAGPGSTFLMTRSLIDLVRRTLTENAEQVSRVASHDWLIYAIARASGLVWHIDHEPTVNYRQHDSNVIGANLGAASALARLRLIGRHWHRDQVHLVAQIVRPLAQPPQGARLEELRDLTASTSVRSRIALASRAGELRRRPRDRFILRVLVSLGVW